MKRAFILCLFWAFTLNAGNCATSYFKPLQPLNMPSAIAPLAQNPSSQDINANYSKINEIEKMLFGRYYANQNILLRLSRIEKSLFSTTYPNSTLSQRVENIILNFNQINNYPGISGNTLSKMEAKVFRRNYAQNDAESRIERLEQQVLGAVQGGDLNQRYETLKSAVNNYQRTCQPNYNYYQDLIPRTTGSQGGWKTIAGNIGNLLLGGYPGSMTGFSPSIDPYAYQPYSNPYNSYYSPGYSQDCRSNTGYYSTNRDYGSQTRVTILD